MATGSDLNVFEDLLEGALDIVGHPDLRLAHWRFANIIIIAHMEIHVVVQGAEHPDECTEDIGIGECRTAARKEAVAEIVDVGTV